MTAEEFVEELKKKRPDMGAKKNDQNLQDIVDRAKVLTPQTRGEILVAFVNYYKLARTPVWADLLDCAEKGKVAIHKDTGERAYFKCQTCKTVFPLWSAGCPRCRKRTEIKVLFTKHRPETLVMCHEDCWQCKHFGRQAIGVSCREFAKGVSVEGCAECICRRCCQETYILRTDKLRYRKMSIDGEIENRSL